MNRKIVFNEFNNNRICVFHNEVVARAFLIEYALEYGAIEADKAIAYDTFRDFFLAKYDDKEKVNDQIRELFLIEFFENNKLKYLINNDYPETISRFTSYMISVIKQLKRVIDCEVFNSLNKDFIDDILLLYDKYNCFLNDHNLFEPSYAIPSLDFAPKEVLNNRYTIIAADTKVGCQQFLNQINNPDFIKTINVKNIDKTDLNYINNSKLFSFENSKALDNNLIRAIRKLLDDGVSSSDIAITLCNFDSDISDIEYSAKRYNIPISKAKGYSLLKYPGGKYLMYLSNLYDNNFSIDDMKSFFLERSFPFKDISFNRNLIRFAIDANIDHGSNKIENDYWLKRLSSNPIMKDFYWKFKNIIININTVETISDLKKSLHILELLLFEEGVAWKNSVGENSYSFAIDKLDMLNQSMKASHVVKSRQLFKMFIRLIEKETYVEQGKRDGIRIYEYPLSASLDIPYHFVVDINSKNSEIVDKPLFILPANIEDQKLREEEDLTNNVINEYCLNSGVTSFFFSYKTYDGAQIAPSIFMENNNIFQYQSNLEDKPYFDELKLWEKQKHKKNINLTFFQSKAFERASINILNFDDNGYVNNCIEHNVNDFLLDNIKTKDDMKLLNFSSTSINLFKKCPYAFLIKYLFKTLKNEYNVVQYDALQIGTILHSIFEEFFKKIMSEDSQFYSSKKNEYQDILNQIKNNKFNEYFNSTISPPLSTQIYILDKFKNLESDFLIAEITFFDTYKSIYMEKTFNSIEDINIGNNSYFYALNGKIDRIINLNNGKYAIVDYKSGNAPVTKTWAKKAYKQKVESFDDYQFPCYKKLLEKKNMDVSKATYYSIKQACYCDMWSEEVLEDTALIDKVFDKVMHDIIVNILDGNFIATPSNEICEYCDYRQVCRKRYSTK